MTKWNVQVRITRVVDVQVEAEHDEAAVKEAINVAKRSTSANDVVFCDVEMVEPSAKTAA